MDLTQRYTDDENAFCTHMVIMNSQIKTKIEHSLLNEFIWKFYLFHIYEFENNSLNEDLSANKRLMNKDCLI